MKLPIYQVDAFASRIFSGNPAAVCLLNDWMPDATLQAIAAENNLSETAFAVRRTGEFELRWFTPVIEVELCGHATLATAFVLFELLGWQEKTVCFKTRKSGMLTVEKNGRLFEMDFPSRPPTHETPADGLSGMIGATPASVMRSQDNILITLESEQCVRDLKPDSAALATLDCHGIIVTAKGEKVDFVSRFFAPAVGIDEDPVTGSAHCALTPYWAERLKKTSLHAMQVSRRGGEIFCRDRGKRVTIAGEAALYLEGSISI